MPRTTNRGVNPHTHLASDIVGPVESSSSFVYRPGEPDPTGNVYSDFNALYTALIQIQGVRTILFDGSLVSPCPVPPRTGGGAYNFENVFLTGNPGGSGVFPLPVSVQIQDGTTVENFGSSSYLVSLESVSSTPVMTVSDGLIHLFICDYGVTIRANGTAPFFQVDSGTLVLAAQNGVDYQTGLSAIVNVGPGATVQFSLWDSTQLGNDTISGVVGSFATVLFDASCFGISQSQTGMAGTLNFQLYDFAERVGYSPPQPPWPPVPTPPTEVQSALDRLADEIFGQWADAILQWSTPIDGTVEVPTNFDETLTVPADKLKVGDVLEILAAGEYTVVTNPGFDFARIALSVGSFGFVNGNFGPVPASGTQFIMKVRFCIQTTGVAGTVFVYQENDFGIVISASYIPQQTGPHTFDTTIGSLISVEGYWGPGTPDGNSMVLKTLQANVVKKKNP